jgi:hypothetical protein
MYARSGRRERGFETLAACVMGGWGNRDWIAHDPDFDAIRDDPRFKAVLDGSQPAGPHSGF